MRRSRPAANTQELFEDLCMDIPEMTPEQIRKAMDAQCVYLIQGVNGGPIKIGHTGDLRGRLATFQVASPVELKVLVTIPGGGCDLERLLHKRFAKNRIHGEWFEDCPELQSFLRPVIEQGA